MQKACAIMHSSFDVYNVCLCRLTLALIKSRDLFSWF